MTDEIEKQAEEYAENHYRIIMNDCVVVDNDKERIEQAFQDGAKWGYEKGYEDCRHYAHDYYKPKWHDLRENPNDLPEEFKNVLCFCYGMGSSYYSVGHIIKLGDELSWWINIVSKKLFNVIAWCELPTYKE